MGNGAPKGFAKAAGSEPQRWLDRSSYDPLSMGFKKDTRYIPPHSQRPDRRPTRSRSSTKRSRVGLPSMNSPQCRIAIACPSAPSWILTSNRKRTKPRRRASNIASHLTNSSKVWAGLSFWTKSTRRLCENTKDFLIAKGFAGETIDTRINIVNFLLKKNGVDARLPRDQMPVVETEAAVPCSEDEMKKLFREMDKEEAIRYKFFLGTACRDKEVTYAAWADINFEKKTYTVRGKPDEGFTVKNHESRTIPIPDTLAAALKARLKPNPSARWIFVNEAGVPDNHFLRKLKRIALRAGVNCGQCRTKVTKGKYTMKKQVEVSCATDPVCEHIYLHRFRKTCATRWQEAGVPIRTIQHYLGHKNLETTAFYLGVSDSDRMRDKINEAFGD